MELPGGLRIESQFLEGCVEMFPPEGAIRCRSIAGHEKGRGDSPLFETRQDVRQVVPVSVVEGQRDRPLSDPAVRDRIREVPQSYRLEALDQTIELRREVLG